MVPRSCDCFSIEIREHRVPPFAKSTKGGAPISGHCLLQSNPTNDQVVSAAWGFFGSSLRSSPQNDKGRPEAPPDLRFDGAQTELGRELTRIPRIEPMRG